MTISRLYPRLVVFDAAGAIDFYMTVFGAVLIFSRRDFK